jgi:hypothetical protein
MEAQRTDVKADTAELRVAAVQKYEKARDLFREIGASDRVLMSIMRIALTMGC